MILQLVQTIVESKSITAPVKSPAIDVGSAGGDSIAFVMVASAASTPGTATIQLEASLDGANYVTVGSTVSVSANGVYSLEKDRPAFKWYRVAYAIASGSYTSTLSVLVKGDKQ